MIYLFLLVKAEICCQFVFQFAFSVSGCALRLNLEENSKWACLRQCLDEIGDETGGECERKVVKLCRNAMFDACLVYVWCLFDVCLTAFGVCLVFVWCMFGAWLVLVWNMLDCF